MDTTIERDPIEEYWASHGPAVRKHVVQPLLFKEIEEQEAIERMKNDPWLNGRYAYASIVWGFIIMLLWSLSI